MDQQNQGLFDLHLDQQSFVNLKEAAKWARFIAIIGFIISALMVLFALFAGTLLSSMGAGFGDFSMIGSGLIAGFYLVLALIWFFPNLFLFRFSSQMQQSIRLNEQIKLQQALTNLKAYFKFLGILFLVIICIYALVFIVAIIMGIASR